MTDAAIDADDGVRKGRRDPGRESVQTQAIIQQLTSERIVFDERVGHAEGVEAWAAIILNANVFNQVVGHSNSRCLQRRVRLVAIVQTAHVNRPYIVF